MFETSIELPLPPQIKSLIFGPKNKSHYRGRPYDTLCSAGVKKEAEYSECFASEGVAIDRYNKSLREYITQNTDADKYYDIVWRDSPYLTNCRMGDEPDQWRVYSRLTLREAS